MSRRAVSAIAAVVGFVAGAILVFAISTSPDGDPIEADDSGPDASPATTTATASPATEPTAGSGTSSPPVATAPVEGTGSEVSPLDENVLLIWTSGRLAAGLGARVADLAQSERTSVVRAVELELVRSLDADGRETESYSNGWSVPIDALAVDPANHGNFMTATAAAKLDALAPGQGLLSAAGAELRGGAEELVLEFSSGSVEIVGVIDDASASGAELIVDFGTGESLGILDERYLLVAHDGDRSALQEGTVAALAEIGPAAPIRFRSPAETTWMRHGDAVLPLAQVKLHFGEFAVRDRGGRDVDIDPGWVAANIVEAEVPILGTVRCHRLMIDPLESALRELVDRAVTHVIDPDEFSGCYNPRRIDAGLPLSRHSWGIALDLNTGDNPRGSFPTQDPRLVDAMRTAGFGWGGSWLVPDPAHYEIIEPR